MKYGILFLTVGIVLGVEAILLGGAYWLLAWPCVSFGLIGLAYLGLGARVFGKRSNGTMAWYSVVALLPYLLLTWATWLVVKTAGDCPHFAKSAQQNGDCPLRPSGFVRRLSKENCYNEVVPGLFVGRRPLPGELPDGIAMIVDLTAEFPERSGVRVGREYVVAPMLDTGATTETAFRSLVERIANCKRPVYIHCAQGHGRTGMVAAAVLVEKGDCATVEEAVSKLRAARPGIDLGRNQLAFVQRVCSRAPDKR